MSELPLVSIIINNYNYGRFLAEAIDSALQQDYSPTEVIVVDDGSTDHSRDIIARYGNRIVPLLQANRGQASAFNAGFQRSRGDVILFLDADDALYPSAVTRAVEALSDGKTIKVHWTLDVVDERGSRTGKTCPKLPLSEGNLRDAVLKGGPWVVATPPTSCNAWTRGFLETIMPVPEGLYRICADSYLVTLGWVSGPCRMVLEPQGRYRVHGQNNYAGRPFFQKLRRDMEVYQLLCSLLADYCSRYGLALDPRNWAGESWWMRRSWPHQVYRSSQELSALIPVGECFLLVDDENFGGQICENRQQLPFLEKNGQYWGAPADDETALWELERMRKQLNAHFIVFAWPAFWWLNHYRKFTAELRARFRCLLENERIVVFDLRTLAEA